jgi:hypothetical protein
VADSWVFYLALRVSSGRMCYMLEQGSFVEEICTGICGDLCIAVYVFI